MHKETPLATKKRAATIKATADMLALAREGRFGTPEKPDRNGGDRSVFWSCYFGHRKASEYKNTISYPAAKAGEKYREETEGLA